MSLGSIRSCAQDARPWFNGGFLNGRKTAWARSWADGWRNGTEGFQEEGNEADASGCAAADLPDDADQLRTATERSGLHHHDQPGQDAHHPHG